VIEAGCARAYTHGHATGLLSDLPGDCKSSYAPYCLATNTYHVNGCTCHQRILSHLSARTDSSVRRLSHPYCTCPYHQACLVHSLLHIFPTLCAPLNGEFGENSTEAIESHDCRRYQLYNRQARGSVLALKATVRKDMPGPHYGDITSAQLNVLPYTTWH